MATGAKRDRDALEEGLRRWVAAHPEVLADLAGAPRGDGARGAVAAPQLAGLSHAEGGMADMSLLDYSMMIQDSAVETFLTEYRINRPGRVGANDSPLVAAVLCDRLSDGISLVYSFYEPDLDKRSLGNYIIMEQVAFAKARSLPFVYLGYWIAGSRKMAYKTRFTPQEHLTPMGWVRRSP